MEDVMSTCNSIESSDLEFPDDKDSSMASSLHCWADDKLHISESKEVAGLFTCKIGALLVRLFFVCIVVNILTSIACLFLQNSTGGNIVLAL
jgi:hypothetical protein